MSTLLEIRAIYRGERFRFDNASNPAAPVIIGEAHLVDRGNSANSANGVAVKNGDCIGIKGEVDSDESMIPNQTYRLMGRWTQYLNKRRGTKETQFAFNSYVLDQPASREAVTSYLVAAGQGRGIGYALAERLWSAWGAEAIARLREDPQSIREVLPSFDLAKARQISDWLRERFSTEQTTIEISELMKGRGFPKATVKHAVREWGNRAAEVISRNPFKLLRFRGCGFKRCDAMYQSLGHDLNRLRRQMFCLWYAMQSSGEGHTWFPADTFGTRALKQAIPRPDLRGAIKLGKLLYKWFPSKEGGIATQRELGGRLVDQGGSLWIADGAKAEAETMLAKLVVDAICESGEAVSVTQWGTRKEEVVEIPKHARCARCGKLLTAKTIHVLDGRPYGPTCIGYVTGGAM